MRFTSPTLEHTFVFIHGFQTGIQVPIYILPCLTEKLASTTPTLQKSELRHNTQITGKITREVTTTSENTHQTLTFCTQPTCCKCAHHLRILFLLWRIYLIPNFNMTSIKLCSLPPNQHDLQRCSTLSQNSVYSVAGHLPYGTDCCPVVPNKISSSL